MNRFRILTDHNRLKRVTVEHGVINIKPVLKAQDRVAARFKRFTRKPANDFHLTLFHFGQPELLHQDISRARSHLKFEHFLHDFLQLIESVEHTITESFELPAASLAEFGSPESPAIVITFDMPAWMIERRQIILDATIQFLLAMGIGDPYKFMDESKHLHFQLPEHYRPHVSLGHTFNNEHLPPVDVDGIDIEFTRSRLRNVKVRQDHRWVWSS
jgi:hypothetical protein